MPYFQTTNASVDYTVAGHVFTFEKVEVLAGSWRGVLEVPEGAAADALRTIKGPVSEVSADEYAVLKKKWLPNFRASRQSVEPQPQTLHEVAASVAAENQESESSTATEPLAAAAPTLADGEDVDVKLGAAEPPNELSGEATLVAKKPRHKKTPPQQ